MCNFLRLRCLSEPQKVVFENYYNSYAEAQSLHNMFRSQAGSPSHMAMKEGEVTHDRNSLVRSGSDNLSFALGEVRSHIASDGPHRQLASRYTTGLAKSSWSRLLASPHHQETHHRTLSTPNFTEPD